MKRLAWVAFIFLLLAILSVPTYAKNEKEIQAKAMQGDYQAQRNLAYGYATGGWGQKKDVSMACSWYLLVLRSDSPKLDIGDVGNVAVYCDKLDFDKRLAAERKANQLHRQIYGKR